jgi:hypothetical protein
MQDRASFARTRCSRGDDDDERGSRFFAGEAVDIDRPGGIQMDRLQ